MLRDKNEIRLKNFQKLFEDFYPELCVLAYNYINDLEASKEIVMAVFLEVWDDKVDLKFKNQSHKAVFFYEAIEKKCVNYIKSKQPKVIKLNNSTKPIIDKSEAIENILSHFPEKEADAYRHSIEEYK